MFGSESRSRKMSLTNDCQVGNKVFIDLNDAEGQAMETVHIMNKTRCVLPSNFGLLLFFRCTSKRSKEPSIFSIKSASLTAKSANVIVCGVNEDTLPKILFWMKEGNFYLDEDRSSQPCVNIHLQESRLETKYIKMVISVISRKRYSTACIIFHSL